MATGVIQVSSTRMDQVGNLPWSSASKVADKQGVNIAVFGHPGCGKTTLAAGAQDTEHGRNAVFFDFGDAGIRSIRDRPEIQVVDAKKMGWDGFDNVLLFLKSTIGTDKQPFKTWVFDTMSGMQKVALAKVMATTPSADMRGNYGKANDYVNQVVSDCCALSREQGINVIFNAHAAETQDGENGIVYIRMSLTPGVLNHLLSTVDSIGYLSEGTTSKLPRELLLRSNARVIAKYRQPRSGPQLPEKIKNPSMAALIEHTKGVRTYPVIAQGEPEKGK